MLAGLRFTLASVLLVATSFAGRAQYEIGPLVQPATYTSPSGEWQLSVDPTQRSGAGAARYRMTRNGVEVWTGEKPFTLFQAGVDDRGFVGGVTCANGVSVYGAYLFPLLDPTGAVSLCDEKLRQCGNTGTCAVPCQSEAHLRGLVVNGPADLFIVRVRQPAQGERWTAHRLSSAQLIGAVDPTRFAAREVSESRLESVLAVRGTPLTLVHFSHFDFESSPPLGGARFVLLDEWLHPVWSCEWPNDYDGYSGDAFKRLLRELEHAASLPETPSPRRFELRRFAHDTVLTYAVAPDSAAPLGWRVEVVGERAHVESPAPELPVVELRPIAATALGGPWVDEHWRKLVVGFDDERRIGLIDTTTHTVDVFDALGNAALTKSSDTASFGYRESIGRRLTFARGWRRPSRNANYIEQLAPDGSPALRIERRADGRFFRVVEAAAVAEDGKVAVLERAPYYEGAYAVSIYTPGGVALRTIDLPFASEP